MSVNSKRTVWVWNSLRGSAFKVPCIQKFSLQTWVFFFDSRFKFYFSNLRQRVDSFEISEAFPRDSCTLFFKNSFPNQMRSQFCRCFSDFESRRVSSLKLERERKSIFLCRNLHAYICKFKPNLVNSFWIHFLWFSLVDGGYLTCPVTWRFVLNVVKICPFDENRKIWNLRWFGLWHDDCSLVGAPSCHNLGCFVLNSIRFCV